jgi:hypothetical protein
LKDLPLVSQQKTGGWVEWAGKKLLRQLPISDAVRLLHTTRPHFLPSCLPRSLVSHSTPSPQVHDSGDTDHFVRLAKPSQIIFPMFCISFVMRTKGFLSPGATARGMLSFPQMGKLVTASRSTRRLQYNLDHPHAYPIVHDPTTEFTFHQLPRRYSPPPTAHRQLTHPRSLVRDHPRFRDNAHRLPYCIPRPPQRTSGRRRRDGREMANTFRGEMNAIELKAKTTEDGGADSTSSVWIALRTTSLVLVGYGC